MSTTKKNFLRLASGLDIRALAEQVSANEHLFVSPGKDLKKGDVGYTHQDAQLILLRYPEIPEDVLTNKESLERVSNDLYAKNRDEWKIFTALYPPLYGLMESVQGTHLGGVAIVRLPPGGIIKAHVDTGLSVTFYNRFHIVINGPEQCWFICGGEKVEQLTGEAWWFNAKEMHSVKNLSEETRISVSIDISSL